MFVRASENSIFERDLRKKRGEDRLKYGIPFLDDALLGILRSDLILIGAPSGIGKTSICCNIALANIANGKKVHYIALEAEPGEIESRIKYQILTEFYFNDPGRPHLGERITFDNWFIGKFLQQLEKYEAHSHDFFQKAFGNLFIFYKESKFGIAEFVEKVIDASDETDLIIIDHVHYFDSDEMNENKAMKEIAKTARMLALEHQKPLILVSHLRKRDKNNNDLVPGLDEFHGSSDLFKIATRVITFSPGMKTPDGCFETFFRIPKNRINGEMTHFIGRVIFNPKKGVYETTYKIGSAFLQRDDGFTEVESHLCPDRFRTVPSRRDDKLSQTDFFSQQQTGQNLDV